MKNQLARFTGFIAAILFLMNLQLCAQQHAPDMITPQPSVPQNPEPPKALHQRLEGALIMPLSSEITPRAVLNAVQRVADWQLAHPATNPPTGWIQVVDDAGMMALAGISGDPQYRDAMLAMGQTNDWQLGSRFYDADFHCIGQTYAELYLLYRDNRMIGPLQERFDGILPNRPNCKASNSRGRRPGPGKTGRGAMCCSWGRRRGCAFTPPPATRAISISR